MDCKKVGLVACGLAMGMMAMAPQANAQAVTETVTTTVDQPSLVSGTVVRYYVDRSGYVTAMDVQTGSGIQLVRFSPSLGQRLYSGYPVGSQVSVYTVNTTRRYSDVVSVGDAMPSPDAMTYRLTDADLLDSVAYIQNGTKEITVRGKLSNVITNDNGEVIGLVLDGADQQVAMKSAHTRMVDGRTMMVLADGTMMPVQMRGGRSYVRMTDGSRLELMKVDGRYVVPESMTGAQMKMVLSDGRQLNMDTVDGRLMVMNADGTMMPVDRAGRVRVAAVQEETMTTPMAPTMGMGTLVRVPREFRHGSYGNVGSTRVTPLFRGSEVVVTGYPESPRYGVVSLYGNRISANALVINGRTAGALAMPRLMVDDKQALFGGVNIGGNSRTAEELRAAKMGYDVYGSTNVQGTEPMMTN